MNTFCVLKLGFLVHVSVGDFVQLRPDVTPHPRYNPLFYIATEVS